jgi:hypothetical protein
MSPVKSEKKNVVSELSYFKPTEDWKDVVTSLEEWAARILEPDIPVILEEAMKNMCNCDELPECSLFTVVTHTALVVEMAEMTCPCILV